MEVAKNYTEWGQSGKNGKIPSIFFHKSMLASKCMFNMFILEYMYVVT